MPEISIEQELIKATKVGKAGGEDRQTFLGRLLKRAIIVTEKDEVWAALSEGAQAWVNDAINVGNANKELADDDKKPLPEIPGSEPDEGDEATPDKGAEKASRQAAAGKSTRTEESDVKTKSKKKGGANGKAPITAKKNTKPAAKVAAPKRPTASAKKPARKPQAGPTNVTVMKQMVMKEPWLKPAEVHDRMTKKGRTCTVFTISAHLTDFRHSIRMLEEGGHLKDAFKFFERAEKHNAAAKEA